MKFKFTRLPRDPLALRASIGGDPKFGHHMAFRIVKTEHNGAKNGGGAWMTRREAKEHSNRRRRQNDKLESRRLV